VPAASGDDGMEDSFRYWPYKVDEDFCFQGLSKEPSDFRTEDDLDAAGPDEGHEVIEILAFFLSIGRGGDVVVLEGLNKRPFRLLRSMTSARLELNRYALTALRRVFYIVRRKPGVVSYSWMLDADGERDRRTHVL
jgi:hypothetical protein